MTEMTPRQRLLTALRRGQPDRVPCFPAIIRWVRYHHGCTCPRHQLRLAEEFGLVGAVVLLAVYLLLLIRGFTIAAFAPTHASRLLAGAVTMIFFTYAFVNMGMVSGILPVVGVPLPFISYGGTALVTLCLGIGILMSIQRSR